MYASIDEIIDRTGFTNGDRIRAMSDEKLAKLLYDFGYEAYEFALNPAKKPLADTQAGFLHWLKQPAKEK